MGGDIIPDDNIAAAQLGHEEMLDISFQRIAVQGPFNEHRRLHATQRNGADDGDISAPFFKALVNDGALSTWGPRVCAGHIQMDAKLINEPEAARWEGRLFVLKGGPLLRIGFGGAPSFF